MLINLFHLNFLQLLLFQESSGDTSNSPFSSQYRSTLDRSGTGRGAGNIVMSGIKVGEKDKKLSEYDKIVNWRSTMSSPRTGILSLIWFDSGQD